MRIYRINHSYQKTFRDISEKCKVYNINDIATGLFGEELDFISCLDTKLVGIKQNHNILLDDGCAFEFTISHTDSNHQLVKRLSVVLEQIDLFNNKNYQLDEKLNCIEQLDFLENSSDGHGDMKSPQIKESAPQNDELSLLSVTQQKMNREVRPTPCNVASMCIHPIGWMDSFKCDEQ